MLTVAIGDKRFSKSKLSHILGANPSRNKNSGSVSPRYFYKHNIRGDLVELIDRNSLTEIEKQYLLMRIEDFERCEKIKLYDWQREIVESSKGELPISRRYGKTVVCVCFALVHQLEQVRKFMDYPRWERRHLSKHIYHDPDYYKNKGWHRDRIKESYTLLKEYTKDFKSPHWNVLLTHENF